MRTPSRHAKFIGLLIPAFLAGCSAGLDSIPLGRWEGTGTWEGLKRNDAGQLTPAHGEYRVTVTFTKVTHGGRPLVAATVLSDHPDGSTIDLKGVEVLMLLSAPAAKADGSLELHAEVSDSDRTQARNIDEPLVKHLLEGKLLPPAHIKPGPLQTRLELTYVQPEDKQEPNEFVETFTFSGDSLVKSGIYPVKPDAEYIRWTERLKRTR